VSCACKNSPPPAPADHVLSEYPYAALPHGSSAGIIGVTQHGKSTYAMGWAGHLVGLGESTLAWDPAWQWAANFYENREDAKPGPLARCVTVSELEKSPDLLRARRLNLAVRPDDIFALGSEIADQFTRFLYVVRRVWMGRIHLFIDEVNQVAKYAAEYLDDIAERWAKDGYRPIFIGQRWTHFTPNMRAEIEWLISFLQVKETDLRFLKTDAGSAFTSAISTLGKYQYRATNLRKIRAELLAALGLDAVPPQQEKAEKK
jgi:hypothetical protein